jgi:hypothetical protein
MRRQGSTSEDELYESLSALRLEGSERGAARGGAGAVRMSMPPTPPTGVRLATGGSPRPGKTGDDTGLLPEVEYGPFLFPDSAVAHKELPANSSSVDEYLAKVRNNTLAEHNCFLKEARPAAL